MSGLSRLSIVGYGAGDAANNLAFTTATMFLLVYYTDVAGIPAAAAGTLLLVVRIFDAFADVFAGRMVDRSFSPRFGKFRPFILFGSLPLLLLSFATFNVPRMDGDAMLLYAYVTYAALGLAYSLVNIPFGSMAGAMTQEPRERAALASARTMGALLVAAVLGIFVAPLLKTGENLQPVFTSVTLVFVFVGFALYLLTVATATERVQRDVPRVSFRQSVATLRGNRPLLMLCISSLLFLTGMLTVTTAQLYYFRDVLQRLDLYPAVTIIQVAVTVVLAFVLPKVVAVHGKRNVYIAGGCVGALGGLVVFFTPPAVLGLCFLGLSLLVVGVVAVNILVWALEADTVEYGEWKTGVRSEGMVYALFSFTRKTGQAIGGALAAYALAWGGYAAGAAQQSASAIVGIQAATGLLPALLTLLAVGVMFWYPLTDRRHAEIVAEIHARRTGPADISEQEGGRTA